ncbi:hypothetical protein FPV67DRAFT_332967 [Lyophyllum atratum]|nr:hypothetical protein FPV67DRAFT_332967 [Lyophyllum atratum]
MSIPVLPRELIDIIIDYLHCDQLTLMACCLVCKAWLSSGRYHLLYDIRIDHLTADRILRAPHLPSVAGFIRRLMICDMYPLPQGIEVFSSITSLYIYGCLPYAQMRVILLSMFPMLTYLELHGLKFKSFGEMIELFCSFPRIQTLTLSCTWENDKDSSLHAYPSSMLRTLNIRAGSHALLPWLTHSMPPHLSTLRIFKLSAKHVLPLQAALKALGGSLHRLELGLCSWMDADSFVGKINLHHNSALRSNTGYFGHRSSSHK